MIPEPFKSRLMAAGKAKDHAQIDQVIAELRKERPELFYPVSCLDCANQRQEGEVLWCKTYSQFRSSEIKRQCGDFKQANRRKS